MTPLQFQKQLRLQEARRLMLGEGYDATTAGFRVGYSEPSHFNREYKRLFGRPPRSPIGNCSVIASKANRPPPCASSWTIARSSSASLRSAQVANPSFSQRAGSWYGLSVASWKTMWVTSCSMATSRYAVEPPPSHMKIVRSSL